MKVLESLDKLESLVMKSVRIPSTKKVIIDSDRLLELINQIRQEIHGAFDILTECHSVVKHAAQEARRIQAKAKDMLAEANR